MLDSKLVLQAPYQFQITASNSNLPYYGILWTPATTPFSITVVDFNDDTHTFDVDKFLPAIAVKKVTTITPGNTLYLLHNKNGAVLPQP